MPTRFSLLTRGEQNGSNRIKPNRTVEKNRFKMVLKWKWLKTGRFKMVLKIKRLNSGLGKSNQIQPNSTESNQIFLIFKFYYICMSINNNYFLNS